MSCYRAFSLVYLVRVLWHGLDDTTIVESCGLVKCLHLFPRTEVTKYSGKMHEIFKEQKFVFYFFTEGWKQRFCFQEKKISCSSLTEKHR